MFGLISMAFLVNELVFMGLGLKFVDHLLYLPFVFISEVLHDLFGCLLFTIGLFFPPLA